MCNINGMDLQFDEKENVFIVFLVDFFFFSILIVSSVYFVFTAETRRYVYLRKL